MACPCRGTSLGAAQADTIWTPEEAHGSGASRKSPAGKGRAGDLVPVLAVSPVYWVTFLL